jgi:hypothetical protein
MKILNRQQFLALPSGTLYSTDDPALFVVGLAIKGDTIYDGKESIDFFKMDLIHNVPSVDVVDVAEQTGESFELEFDSWGRDGLFERDALYAVYSTQDIAELAQTISKCVGHE